MKIIKTKILIACDSSRSLLHFRGRLIEELAKKNHVAVFTPTITQDSIKEELDKMGVMVYENNLDASKVSIWSDIKYILSLFKVMMRVKPDVFFPYAFKPVIYGCLIANIQGVKRIVPMLTGLGNNFINSESQSSFLKKLTRTLLKLSLRNRKKTRIILQNADDHETLLRYKTISNKNEVTIVNGSGVDLSYYDFSEPDLQEVVFLMISRLINAKGISEFLEAAKLIHSKSSNVNFLLVGPYDENIDAIDGDLYQEIQSSKIVRYIGEVQDIRPYIKQSSVVVLPSYYGEGIPRCILEAMAMGRAILTTNSVGCKETVNNDLGKQNGFLIPAKNAKALASKMEYFLQNPRDIAVFGNNSREYAQQRFDVNLVNQQMLNVLCG